jgi:hypothetical protein
MRTAGISGVHVVPLVLIAAITANLDAQMPSQPSISAEYRADMLFGGGTAAQVGGGAQVPLGYYVRLGVTGAAGVTSRDGDSVASGRVDVIARYLLDPFREVAWTPSFGGGLTVRYDDGDARPRTYLAVVLDVEGPRIRRAFSPALQLGLGGGTRIGVALRATRGPWR